MSSTRRRGVVALLVSMAACLTFVSPAQAAPPGYSVHGIDVSYYQGTIDWAAVAGAGTDFAYARASLGSGYTDPTSDANHDGAKANGLYFGAYHFARPDQSGGVQQADHFLDRAQVRDDGRTLPPMLDLEWGPDSVPTCFGLSQSGMAGWVRDFVDRVEARTGRTAAIYTNRNWWNQCVGTAADFGHHPLFHPCYCDSPGTIATGWSRFTVWQYTSTGRVAGVSGNVDQDVFNGTMADLAALAGDRSSPDFSGDGNADVLARHAGGHDLYLFTGNGSGRFAGDPVKVGNNWSAYDVIFSPGDFSGDGNADVLARHAGDHDLYLFTGNGSGRFAGDPVKVGNNWSAYDRIF